MRVKLGTTSFVLQRGSMNVAADGSSVVVADPAIDTTGDVAVVINPHGNVSVSPHKQTVDIFLVTTSDTADTTADYLIASTS